MTHTRVATGDPAADAYGCITTTHIPESAVLGTAGAIADADYDTFFDGQGFPKPGNLLTGVSEQGGSVVVDVDP
jgi:hypothetical protein